MPIIFPSKNTILRIFVILAVIAIVAGVGYLRYDTPWSGDFALQLLLADIGWLCMMACVVVAVISLVGIGSGIHQLGDSISEHNDRKEKIETLRRRVNKLERELKEIKREQGQKGSKLWRNNR